MSSIFDNIHFIESVDSELLLEDTIGNNGKIKLSVLTNVNQSKHSLRIKISRTKSGHGATVQILTSLNDIYTFDDYERNSIIHKTRDDDIDNYITFAIALIISNYPLFYEYAVYACSSYENVNKLGIVPRDLYSILSDMNVCYKNLLKKCWS